MHFGSEENNKWIWTLIFAIVAVLCFTFFHDIYLNAGFIKDSITYLDQKANTVLALTGASTSASVAVTMIPGDVANPIAEKLADISSYSIIILAAVHLEKYLITIAGEIVLKLIMPISMIFAAINEAFIENEEFKSIVKKLCIFSISVIMVVPASVYLSRMVEDTYHENVQLSIEETEREAEEIKEQLAAENQNILEKVVSSVSGGTSALLGRFENSLNNFIEAIAVMIITACVLPLVTFGVLIWLIKTILRVDFKAPQLNELAKKVRINPKRIKESL